MKKTFFFLMIISTLLLAGCNKDDDRYYSEEAVALARLANGQYRGTATNKISPSLTLPREWLSSGIIDINDVGFNISAADPCSWEGSGNLEDICPRSIQLKELGSDTEIRLHQYKEESNLFDIIIYISDELGEAYIKIPHSLVIDDKGRFHIVESIKEKTCYIGTSYKISPCGGYCMCGDTYGDGYVWYSFSDASTGTISKNIDISISKCSLKFDGRASLSGSITIKGKTEDGQSFSLVCNSVKVEHT